MTGLLFTLIWFPLVGLAVSRLVGRVNLFLAGAGMNGALLSVGGALHVPLKGMIVAVGVASLAIVILSREDGRRIPSSRSGWEILRPSSRLRMTGSGLALALPAVALLTIAAIVPLNDYDGRAFWLLKAKAIAHESSIDGPFFHGATFSPRNEYPLLVPLDAATVLIAARELDDRHVRWLFVLFAAALALEVGRRAGPWLGALVLLLPQVAIDPAGGALTAYNDLALAAFVACAVFELASREPDPLRCGLWLSFFVLTKNEGLPFAAMLLVVAAFVFRARVWIAALPVSIATAALFLWRSRIEPTDEARFSLAALNADRAGDALRAFGPHVFAFADWGVFWIAVAIAAVVLARRRAWRPLLIGGAAIVPMLFVYLVMYVVSNWRVEELVDSTAPRLLTHFVGPAMLLLGSSLHADHSND